MHTGPTMPEQFYHDGDGNDNEVLIVMIILVQLHTGPTMPEH